MWNSNQSVSSLPLLRSLSGVCLADLASMLAQLSGASGTYVAVSLVFELTVMSRTRRCESFQVLNRYRSPPIVRASGPLMLVDPFRMSVAVQGAGCVSLPADNGTPPGTDTRRSVEVLGCSSTEVEAEVPSLSVTVRRTSRNEGYS